MKTIAHRFALAITASIALLSTTGATWPSASGTQVLARPEMAAAVPEVALSETPAWADTFVDSIGIDSKFADHNYPALVTQWLEWSGIRHLRESAAPSALMIGVYGNLGRHGINHSVGLLRGFAAKDLVATLKAFAPYVDYVEPANEADNFTHPNFNQMRSDQIRLWTTVRGNAAFSKVLVSGPSFANPSAHAALVGPLDRYEDFGQIHNATCNWNPGVTNPAGIDAATQQIRPSTVYKPIMTMETGYNDNPVRGCSISDAIIAKYITRTTTERWLHGEPRTYFDSLVDNLSDPVFGNLGLLHVNGSPKAQFIALGNLARLLADRGSAPKQTRVSYGISGITSDMHHILLGRRDGSYDLLIYRELPCWDHYGKAPISVATLPVSLTIPGVKHAVVYKYNSSYSFSSASLAISGARTGRFLVSDSISIVHFAY